jgi:tRNA dimethylallyltransferase
MMQQFRPFILFLSGPTASGKTDFSLEISEQIPVEIVNADMGQFYTPLSIGTAKPDWRKQSVPHHLFDIVDKPLDCNVKEYRRFVLDKIDEILSRGKTPLVVGGSLFYLKSLLYPPLEIETKKECVSFEENANLWEKLQEIDPKRASQLHPNDIYRVKRALDIWYSTGKKPSECQTKFNAPFDFLFMFIAPDRDLLFNRINQRTIDMFRSDGWVNEAKAIMETEWEDFICRKNLIGYPEVFQWVREGEKREDLPVLIERIQIETRKYAKRQLTFWKQLEKVLGKECSQSSLNCRTLTIREPSEGAIEMVKQRLEELSFDSKKELG